MKPDRANTPITVQSSTVELGEALPAYARTGIQRVAGKYFGQLSGAAVYFSREGASYRCTVNMQMGALRIVTGEAAAPDCYTAFDAALEKAAKQLRRRKRALRDNKPIGADKDVLLRESLRGGSSQSTQSPAVRFGPDASLPPSWRVT